MNHCSAEYPYGINEMEKVGLTPIPSLKVKPPRIKESPIHIECELYGTMEVGDGSVGSATIVVGRIVAMHVATQAYADGKILIDQIKPLSRLAGHGYGKTSDVFDLPRPTF
jgi:flavin reductase (DIM6/NTAB) family NADH-FMN oxidoreductase RutF